MKKPFKKIPFLSLCVIGTSMLTTEIPLRANIVTLGSPFTATATETFDEFRPGYVGNAINIFSGQATLSGGSGDSQDYIWRNGPFLVGFGLGPFTAIAQSGNQGYGNSLGSSFNLITFQTGVTSFGGYWGSAVGNGPINLDFYDQAGNLIGSDNFTYASPGNDGTLEWQGWQSSVPIYSIDYSGAWVVDDTLEISTAPVTEFISPMAGISILSFVFIALVKLKENSTHSSTCTRSP